MSTSLIRTTTLALFVGALACGTAFAHDPQAKTDQPTASTADQSKMDHSKMDHSKMDHSQMDHGKMAANSHDMPATVDNIDRNTGMVDVTSEGMKMKVHFPPATLAEIKPGDKITLHLGFTR